MSIPGSSGALFLATAAGAGGYQVERSLRFNSSDSAFLSRAVSTAGNRKTFTFSCWLKRGALSSTTTYQQLFSAGTSLSSRDVFFIDADTDDTLAFYSAGGLVGTALMFRTNAVFRDTSAWYHILLSIDTTQATSTNRVKLYVNSVEQTFATITYPSQNADSLINSAITHNIAAQLSSGEYLSGYLADIHFIDGQALTPSSFTEVSATTGQLIPKAYTGTFTGNSFWLQFADNSAATATTLGKDSSGLGNNWTPTNFQVSVGTIYSNGTVSGTAVNPWSYLFDGSLSTTPTSQSPGSTTLTLAQSISFTKLRVYANKNPSESLYINGTALTGIPVNTGASWIDVTSQISSPLTSIKVESLSSGQYSYIYAIEVNDVVLLDGSAKNIDSLVDTPTSYGTGNSGGDVRGNYATLNPLDRIGTSTYPATSAVLSNGNLDWSTIGQSGYGFVRGTIGVVSGKWYWEVTATNTGDTLVIGLARFDALSPVPTYPYLGQDSKSWGYVSSNGQKYTNDSGSSYGASYGANDVIGVAYDADNGTLTFYKNGTSQGQAYSSLTSGPYFAALSDFGGSGTTGCSATFNFGQRAFAYTAPSGFKALCTANLPAPLVTKPSTVMDVLLWSGNSTNGRNITGLGFNPDFVWIKRRSSSYSNLLFDSVRGFGSTGWTRQLISDSTAAEDSGTTNTISSFNNDGFTLGTDGGVNVSGQTYVGWTWDAGSSTVTNTQGSITSQVRANASAGFSVVTYTGTGSQATIGHGLNAAPGLIIAKRRDSTSNWDVYHSSLGKDNTIFLNSTSAVIADSNHWGTSTPNSTVFGAIGAGAANNAANGSTQVAYCFAPVTGYSSFGSYTGNGSADGPFIYTGFRPKFILVKNTSVAGAWEIYDSVRNPYNVMALTLLPNASDAEITASNGVRIDFTSNGFKWRDSGSSINGSGNTIIWAAFAESPFQYARAR